MLGVYANLLTRGEAVRIVQHAKERGWFVVMGGPEPANYGAEYLDAGADVIVRGEGENALAALLTRLKSGGALSEDLPSLIFRAPDGSLVSTAAAPLIQNLDAQPWPDRERIDTARYVSTWRAGLSGVHGGRLPGRLEHGRAGQTPGRCAARSPDRDTRRCHRRLLPVGG